jgi:hypothetical protein
VLPWCRTRNEGTDSGAPQRPTPTHHRRSAAGDVARGDSLLGVPPGVRGRPDRVRGDARAGLPGELEASVDRTAGGPPPTSESESTGADAILIIPGAASAASKTVGEFVPAVESRGSRLRKTSGLAQAPARRPPTGFANSISVSILDFGYRKSEDD